MDYSLFLERIDLAPEGRETFFALHERMARADFAAGVRAARAAYDAISTLEQRALVTNYQKLTEAEARIEKLLTLENGETTEPPAVEEPTEEIGTPTVIIITLTAVLVIAVVAIIICDSVIIKKNKKAEEGEKKDENENDKN